MLAWCACALCDFPQYYSRTPPRVSLLLSRLPWPVAAFTAAGNDDHDATREHDDHDATREQLMQQLHILLHIAALLPNNNSCRHLNADSSC